MSIQSKESKVEKLRRELREAEADLATARQVRYAEPKPGSKIYIRAVFPGSAQVYEYMALRTENPRATGANWYITGRTGKLTWDEVVSLVERAEYEIFPMRFIQV